MANERNVTLNDEETLVVVAALVRYRNDMRDLANSCAEDRLAAPAASRTSTIAGDLANRIAAL